MENKNKQGEWKILVLFIFISLILFSNSISNPFQYDDYHHIAENPHLKKLDNIPEYFYNTRMFSQFADVRHYRPLLLTTYAVNYAVGGLNPSGYRMVNLLFHTGSAFLVFLIIINMTGRGKQMAFFYGALAAGLIFLVHPFNSEVVNYISARSTVMCSFLYLLAFWCWVMYRRLAVSSKQLADKTAHSSQLTVYYYIASLLAFISALLTKEIAITLPLIIFLYDLCVSRNSITEKPIKIMNNILSYIPFFVFAVLPYSLTTIMFVKHKLLHIVQRPFLSQVSTELVVMIKYIRLMLLPYGLTIYHDIPVYTTLLNPVVILSGIFIIIILAAAIILLLKTSLIELHLISFMVFWFFVVMLPTSIISLNVLLQENRGYLSAVSFAVIAGIGLGIVNKRNKYITTILLIILTIAYAGTTYARNMVWKDAITLWSDTISKNPYLETGYINLSMAYQSKNMHKESVAELRKLISIKPDSYRAHKNLGWIYKAQGNFLMAFEELEKAVSIKTDDAILHNDLGAFYYEQKLLAPSELHLLKAIELDPDYTAPHLNIGLLYTAQGKYEYAESHFRNILTIDPDNEQAAGMLRMLNSKKKL